MSGCCLETQVERFPLGETCPESGAKGKAVERQTIKALLTEGALQRLTTSEYRFCADPDCRVVYFGADGVRFTIDDLRVGVWQKLPFGARQVCYCFGESEASIRQEIEGTGRSTAAERIRAHIAAGRCACEVRNPRGVCCLGDVIAAVTRVEAAVAREPNARSRALERSSDAS